MYCTAIVDQTRIANTPNGDEEMSQSVRCELADFDAVIRFLRAFHDRNVTKIADSIAEDKADPTEWASLGGFTVKLENQFGNLIEIALGSKYGLLMRLLPRPLKIYRNGPDKSDTLNFYIDGGHHTEFELRDLALVDDCIKRLADWLESGAFPENAG